MTAASRSSTPPNWTLGLNVRSLGPCRPAAKTRLSAAMRVYEKKPGTRRYKNYDPKKLTEAIQKIKDGKLSLKNAAEEYKICHTTLWNKLQGKFVHPVGTKTALYPEEEKVITKCVAAMSKFCVPFDSGDLKIYVKGFLDRCGRNVPMFKENKPGSDWVVNFLKRNGLQLVLISDVIKQKSKMSPQIRNNCMNMLHNMQKRTRMIVEKDPDSSINNYELMMQQEENSNACKNLITFLKELSEKEAEPKAATCTSTTSANEN